MSAYTLNYLQLVLKAYWRLGTKFHELAISVVESLSASRPDHYIPATH
jgi:hypothetical protein